MTPDVALSPQAQAPAPILKADMRPTADAAAIARDPRPNIPLPFPPTNSQNAAVTQSKVASSQETDAVKEADATQRVLKPYGVAMLPDQQKQEREAEAEADARAEGVAKSADQAAQNEKVEEVGQIVAKAKAEDALPEEAKEPPKMAEPSPAEADTALQQSVAVAEPETQTKSA